MQYERIKEIAEQIVDILAENMERIEIAGSIRRRVENPRDIEIVCVPRQGERYKIAEKLRMWRIIKGSPFGRYVQVMLPEGVKLDLFMAKPDNFGNIFVIRTGSANFSRHMMIRARKMGYIHRDGYLWKYGVRIPCYDEEDFFKALNMYWIPPERRCW